MKHLSLVSAALIPALLGIISCAVASPISLAETDFGPITTEDLEILLRWGPGLPEDRLDNDLDWRAADHRLRLWARFQIVLGTARERGLTENPAYEAMVWLATEHELLLKARRELTLPVASPTDEEVEAILPSFLGIATGQIQAAWRFMLFSDRERAEQAREALLAGEDFEQVATQMSDAPATGHPGGLIGPMEFEGLVAPEIEEALLTLPLGEVSGIFETPEHFILLRVESRGAQGDPRIARARAWNALLEQRRLEAFERLIADLRQIHTVEFSDLSEETLSDDTIALRVGLRELTVGDLRGRASLQGNPEVALTRLLTREGRETLVPDQLLLAESLARGVITEEEIERHLTWNWHYLTEERLGPTLLRELSEEQGETSLSHAELETLLLDRHGYRQLVEGERLRWGSDGHLVVIDP